MCQEERNGNKEGRRREKRGDGKNLRNAEESNKKCILRPDLNQATVAGEVRRERNVRA